MANEIDNYVAENRERVRRVDNRFIEVDSNRDRDLSFGPTTVEVTVEDVTIYRRSTGSQILFGHPEPEHGFGRGTFGDDKGEWEEVDAGEVDSVFTRQGRRSVARALDGQAGAVSTSKAGTGDDTPLTSNDDLTGVYAVARTSNAKGDPNEVTTRSFHDAVTWVGDPIEFGLFDDDDRLIARVVFEDPPEIPNDNEVRVEITLSVEGEGVGRSVFTDDGDEAVADAIAFADDATGPVEFGFGSGDEDFEKADSELGDEVFRKDNERDIERNRIIARTHVFESEPDDVGMPVELSEMAVFDDDGRMIWATTFRSFDKRDDGGFNAESEFRVR